MADECVDEEAHHDPDGTRHERDTSATLLHQVQGAESAEDVDTAENDLGDVAVAQPRCSKNRGSVVKEKVGPLELLSGLENNAEHGTIEHLAKNSLTLVPQEWSKLH